MKKIKKALLRMLIIAFILVAIIFIFRLYNDYKYKDTTISEPLEYYKDVTNLDLYPKNIEGVDLSYVDEGAMQGFRFIPKNKKYRGVVICYGGSEGSPNFEEAQRLAKKGYETFALFMHGMKNQQTTLVRIPLEQVEDVLEYINKNIKDKEPISILGASKGAEYALNIASKYDDIDNVILIAPSSYNFAGLDFNDYGSSWTYKGEELPYIDIQKSSFIAFIKDMVVPSIIKTPIIYKNIYKSAAEKDVASHAKLINVENMKANIIMIVGKDDKVWDSMDMANRIKIQSKNAKVYSFEGAGHIFGGNGVLNLGYFRMATGGTLENNEQARIESLKIIDDFLEESHK